MGILLVFYVLPKNHALFGLVLRINIRCHVMHAVWRRVRSPFRSIHCTDHQWEQYDVDKAGCRRCGACHECKPHVLNSKCPLVLNDDYTVCCSVTGMMINSSSCAEVEFTSNTTIQSSQQIATPPDVREHIQRTLQWFMQGDIIERCMQDEVTRIKARFAVVLMKEHRFQVRYNRKKAHVMDILAASVHSISPGQCLACTGETYRKCCECIIECVMKLGMTGQVMKKTQLVIGLLYMMKQGLVIHNTQILPKIPTLAYCLPHESMFGKYYALSTKLLCETENEIKLVIRTMSHSL